MRVRTNVGALVTGGVLAAVLSWISVGDGKPPVDRPTPPVQVLQPIPQTAEETFHPVFSRTGKDGVVNSFGWPERKAAPVLTPPSPSVQAPGQPRHTLDSYIFEGLRGAATYLLLFVALHFGLRRLNAGGRWAYAGIGAVSALVCVITQVTFVSWRILEQEGRVSMMLGVALLAGAIIGFSYRWRAGLDGEGDDPEVLRRTLRGSGAAQVVAPALVAPDQAFVDTGRAQYFSGPLQVRTAAPVAFVAALLTGGAYALVRAAFATQDELSIRLQHHAAGIDQVFAAMNSGQPLFELFTFGLITPLLFGVVVLVAHAVLRAMNRTSVLAYIVAGGLSPLLLCLALGPFGLLLGLQGVLPLMGAMGLYRSMAGVEPKRVKEDIVFTDTRDLVGPDHERRTFGRLVRS